MSDSKTFVRMATSTRFSLLSVSDLNQAGYDRHVRAELLRTGRVYRVRHGFYAVDNPPTWRQGLAAACLQVDRGAAVSHRSAVRLHGLREDEDLDLTVRYPFDSQAKGINVHRSRDVRSVDIIEVGGFHVTSLIRTLCDLGLRLPPGEVERLIDHSIATKLIDPADAFRARVGKRGRNGVGAVDAAMADLPGLSHLTMSGPELKLYKIIGRSTVPDPTPQVPVLTRGHQYYVDLGYPDLRIALEYDGHEFHSTRQQLGRDRRRQRHLEQAGWVVIRYVWADLAGLHVPHTLMRIRNTIQRRNSDL